MKAVNPEIAGYLEREILPRYDAFDKAHGRDHALYVMEQARYLGSFYDVDPDILAVAAACHDLGLCVCRETHHLESGKIIRSDKNLRRWFNEDQIETIARAAEDHRASLDHEPRDIYGKIIAEADRQIDTRTVIRRTIQYSLNHYPGFSKQEHWERTVAHLEEKYADGGYLKLWIPESPNRERLEELRRTIRDKQNLRAIFDEIYRIA